MGATHEMREDSRAGSWKRRMPSPHIPMAVASHGLHLPADGPIRGPGTRLVTGAGRDLRNPGGRCLVPIASQRQPSASTPASGTGSSIIQVEGEDEPAAATPSPSPWPRRSSQRPTRLSFSARN